MKDLVVATVTTIHHHGKTDSWKVGLATMSNLTTTD